MVAATPAESGSPPIEVRRFADRALRPLTLVFLALVVGTFLIPAALLASPNAFGPAGPAVQALFAVSTAITAAVILLLLVVPLGPRLGDREGILTVLAVALALGNAARLSLGLRGSGVALEALQAVAFGAPLAVWAVAIDPDLRTRSAWWATPMRWVALAFPLAFLLAALGRVDLGTPAGGTVPVAVGWLLAYGPLLAIGGAAIMGWLSLVAARADLRARWVATLAAPAAAAVVVGFLIAAATSVGFILSATITWGSGYQLFRTPPPLPPLGVAFVIVSLGTAGFVIAWRGIGRERRGVLILLLAAVLCGVFSSPVSVLGVLAALLLAWRGLTAGAAGVPAPAAPDRGTSSGGRRGTPRSRG